MENIGSAMNQSETAKLAEEFAAALRHNELQLYYQPIIDLGYGEVIGFEALMRWTHPEKGAIPPGIFIPIAEQSGLIIDASRWALGESCRALKRIENRIGREEKLNMSVNFSSNDFAAENFLDHAYQILSESDVPAHQITLEITERLLIQQPQNARDVLSLCRKAGMSIAIDDFGTGNSDLNYLTSFPINKLKIDQSVIRTLATETQSVDWINRVIHFALDHKLQLIAEGVETPEEATLLQTLGCNACQGYYFAKPLPEKDLIELLRSWALIKRQA